ncbi:MAG: AMMECR1 domain-containing protein [Spirochaetes bacterium]|nr:AMMECR1 domain-containing protein [Spirochaetota bacterium]
MRGAVRCAVLAAAVFAVLCGHADVGDPLERWRRFTRTPGASALLGWMRCAASRELGGGCRAGRIPKTPPVFGRLGLFVTVLRGREVRGCYGAFDHGSGDLADLLREYLKGALRHDVRHSPVELQELEQVRLVITIAGRPEQTDDLDGVDLSTRGLLIGTDEGGEMVFVPAEVRTVEQIRRSLGDRAITQLSAFRAVTIQEKRGSP